MTEAAAHKLKHAARFGFLTGNTDLLWMYFLARNAAERSELP